MTLKKDCHVESGIFLKTNRVVALDVINMYTKFGEDPLSRLLVFNGLSTAKVI